jgi:hypothetical protein
LRRADRAAVLVDLAGLAKRALGVSRYSPMAVTDDYSFILEERTRLIEILYLYLKQSISVDLKYSAI